MGPTWGPQNPCGPHVRPMKLAIWDVLLNKKPKFPLSWLNMHICAHAVSNILSWTIWFSLQQIFCTQHRHSAYTFKISPFNMDVNACIAFYDVWWLWSSWSKLPINTPVNLIIRFTATWTPNLLMSNGIVVMESTDRKLYYLILINNGNPKLFTM